MGDDLVQRAGPPRLVAGPADRLDGGQVVRRAPAPEEGLPVEVDLDAVDLDRALDRLARQREQALLPSVADQEQVGADRVADQRPGEPAGVDEADPAGPAASTIACSQPSAGKARSGARVKSPVIAASRLTTAAVTPLRMVGTACGAGGDHEVAAQDQPRAAGGHARRADLRPGWAPSSGG